jgi:hypothetical protein
MKLKLLIIGFCMTGFLATGFGQQRQDATYLDSRIVSDFTIIDSEGVTHNLFSLLDDGKTVLLDLFTAT